MERPHWEYYLTVVQDLATISRYVEIAQPNYTTYSVELVRLLLSVGSEIDVVAKILCQQAQPESLANNINDYRTALMKLYPSLPTVKVSMPKYSLGFIPWSDWNSDTNPTWWRSYNKVKHKRDAHYHEANLENTLSAIGGLCVLVCYLYHDFFETTVIKRPLLFLDTKLHFNNAILFGHRYRLPDFHEDEDV